jgi:hypothetical protein
MLIFHAVIRQEVDANRKSPLFEDVAGMSEEFSGGLTGRRNLSSDETAEWQEYNIKCKKKKLDKNIIILGGHQSGEETWQRINSGS